MILNHTLVKHYTGCITAGMCHDKSIHLYFKKLISNLFY